MPSDRVLQDYQAFGQLIRRRRQTLGMSQEALAASALGNPDRKSFVSAIENNRLSNITPSTAKKLSGPLDLKREDIPASLRWPTVNGPSPTEERLRALEVQQTVHPTEIAQGAITRFLNMQMAGALRRSMSEVYRERLDGGLEFLRIWTGRPFSLQSMLFCYALSLIYVVSAGLWSFAQGDISIGAVNLFRTHDWAGVGLGLILPYLGLVFLLLAVAACWYLIWPFGLRELTERQVAARLGCVALIAGFSCGVVEYIGAQTLAAAVLFTVPSCAGISTLNPTRAAVYGALGGIVFGLVAAISSALSDDTVIAVLTSLSEGFIIGGIVGSCAGSASSLIARGLPHLRPSQLAGAGGGVAVGALVSLGGILVASNYAAVSGGTLGLFAVSWLALPFANTAVDFLSLGISHALGRYILSSRARGVSIWGVLILDLVLAVLLIVLTVVVIGLALESVTWGLGVITHSEAFLMESASDPWGQGLWLTLMALSSIAWTWLHFGFVVAPLVAGALTRFLLEKPAAKRLDVARQDNAFDVSVGVLISLRFIVFYLLWAGVALLPIFILQSKPELIEHILWAGWRLADLLI